MALTEADIEEFISLLQQNAELRERVRRVLVDADYARIMAALAESAEERRRFESEMRAFEKDMRTFESEMRAHVEDSRAFEADMRTFEKDMRTFEKDTRSFETDMRTFEKDMRSFEGEMREFKTDALDRFERIDRRFDEVDRRFDAVDRRFDAVDRRFDDVDRRFEDVDRRFNRIEGQLGNVQGTLFEHSLRFNFGSRLGSRFRNIRELVLANHEPVTQRLDDGRISPEDWDEVNRADATMLVRERDAPPGDDRILVIELSRVVDSGDVERAARRARILVDAGIPAIACALGEAATAGARERADALSVALLVDKRDPVPAG